MLTRSGSLGRYELHLVNNLKTKFMSIIYKPEGVAAEYAVYAVNFFLMGVVIA